MVFISVAPYARGSLSAQDTDTRFHRDIGAVIAVFGVWALLAPAVGLVVLTGGDEFSGLASQAVVGISLIALTEVITMALVLAGALLRMGYTGAWPGRAFVFGWPAGAINVAAFGVVAGAALMLQ